MRLAESKILDCQVNQVKSRICPPDGCLLLVSFLKIQDTIPKNIKTRGVAIVLLLLVLHASLHEWMRGNEIRCDPDMRRSIR